MRRVNLVAFTVTGSGAFPMDMLRRDQAWPSETDDALRIEHAARTTFATPPVSVRLIGLGLTPERWQSFGWNVSHIEYLP